MPVLSSIRTVPWHRFRAQRCGALSMALHEGTRLANGEVADKNLNTYSPLRMRDVPDVEIEFVASDEAAVGLGEPATTVVGPAIANAIFAAVGRPSAGNPDSA